MKNYEKYGRELKKYRGGMFCDDYVKPDILKLREDDECDHDCVRCLIFQMLWLLEEDEESEVDWNKVAVDTLILVRNSENETWEHRYFAKFKNGKVYAWLGLETSFSTSSTMSWNYAKLAEPEDNTNWSKIEIDTPILVRDFPNSDWERRYFAKYSNGKIYAWVGNHKSATAKEMKNWVFTKLAETEDEEYEEPETDWSKVEVDTLILVRNSEDKMWHKRHFAKYKNGNVYAWSDGQTSWTAYDMMVWKYAKLAEDAKEDKEPEVDWNEVKIDTPIMVRDHEDGDWFKRYFAEYKNGKIYAWDNGHTSWETSRMIEWKYAKLVEDEE